MKNELKENIARIRVIIVAHEFVNEGGVAYETSLFFLKNKAKEILYIAHPLFSIKETYNKDSRYQYYKETKLIKTHKTKHFHLPEPLLYVKDFLYTLIWSRKGCDIFIGLDPLNALAGLVLRELNIVQKVIYYSIDYFPTRFKNKFMNRIYHMVDKICVRFADETWNVGLMMAKAREKNNGMDRKKFNRQYIVPIGIWFDKSKVKAINKIDKRKMIYAGQLIDYKGIDLAIKTLPAIRNVLPDVHLEIIGMGAGEQGLKRIVKDMGLDSCVTFFGWISNREAFYAKLSNGAVGLATFNTEILDDKIKNADPSKIKDYLLCGMPVITTKALATYKEIEKEKCGIVIDYGTKEFADAVIKLLGDETVLEEYRKNASKYVERFDWNFILSENLKRLL